MKNIKIKITDLKLAALFIVSLFVLGQAFLTLAENKDSSSGSFLDSDQDGLSDQEELAYRTDPFNRDTDTDGYSDGTEVKSGYDPLKPSPGDKLAVINKTENSKIIPALGEKVNLTQKLSEQISNEIGLGDESVESSKEITTEKIEALVEDFLTTYSSQEEILSLSVDNIQIKEQSYDKLSPEEATQKKKEDFTNYLASVFYALSLNSEKPILSTYDFENALGETFQEISTALIDSKQDYFDNLNKKTLKVLETVKDIEVPEEFASLHVQMINMIIHGLSMRSEIGQNEDDPAADLVVFSKISAFLDDFSNFLTEFSNKTSQYEIDNDLLKTKLEKLGLDSSWSKSNSNPE